MDFDQNQLKNTLTALPIWVSGPVSSLNFGKKNIDREKEKMNEQVSRGLLCSLLPSQSDERMTRKWSNHTAYEFQCYHCHGATFRGGQHIFQCLKNRIIQHFFDVHKLIRLISKFITRQGRHKGGLNEGF